MLGVFQGFILRILGYAWHFLGGSVTESTGLLEVFSRFDAAGTANLIVY